MSPTQPSRRQAVTTVGALGLGVVGAASACGSGEASTAASQAVDQASSAVAGAGSQAASAAAQAIAKADIPVGGGRIIDALKVVSEGVNRFAANGDKGVLLILLAAPVVYGFFYPWPYSTQAVTRVPVALVDQDNSSLSRQITRFAAADPHLQQIGRASCRERV